MRKRRENNIESIKFNIEERIKFLRVKAQKDYRGPPLIRWE